MKISLVNETCNFLKGTVKKLSLDPVDTEVTLEIAPGVEITSTLTEAEAEMLGLVAGKEVLLAVEATDVMVAVG